MNNLVSISASPILVSFSTAFSQAAKLIESAKKNGGKVVVFIDNWRKASGAKGIRIPPLIMIFS
jgi:hypothetical protein